MKGRILYVEGIFTQYGFECEVSIVYAPNHNSLKQELWDYLVNFKGLILKAWCLIGDLMKLYIQ
jgi:hypothetical protein